MAKYLKLFFLLLAPSLAIAATTSDIGENSVGRIGLSLYIPRTVRIKADSFNNTLLLSANFTGKFTLQSVNNLDGSIKLINEYEIQSQTVIALEDETFAENDVTYLITPN